MGELLAAGIAVQSLPWTQASLGQGQVLGEPSCPLNDGWSLIQPHIRRPSLATPCCCSIGGLLALCSLGRRVEVIQDQEMFPDTSKDSRDRQFCQGVCPTSHPFPAHPWGPSSGPLASGGRAGVRLPSSGTLLPVLLMLLNLHQL